mmetsp:Transcript_29518/g.59888  ORF Transcript_29518/g.59888 Transcript_29518/m.59888 type:complete len:328 (-) Transcript_29518:268-1251(-)
MTSKSDPLAPSVAFPNLSKSSSVRLLGVTSSSMQPTFIFSMYVLAVAPGSGRYIRFSNRLRIAASKSHGTFVAPRIKTPPSCLPTPSICTRNSVLTRREESASPSERLPHRESTSSINIMARPLPLLLSRAISNKLRTSRSLSPCHLLIRSALLTEKKVLSLSAATALASRDLPVPGGPNRSIPLKGRLSPVNSWGNFTGIITASFKDSLAPSKPATSSHFTSGFSDITTLSSAPRSFLSSSLTSFLFVPSSPSSSSLLPLLPPPLLLFAFSPPPSLPFFCAPSSSLMLPFNSSARCIHPLAFSIRILRLDSFRSYFIPDAKRVRPS